MVSIGLFASNSEALGAYGMLRMYADQAGIEDVRSMGSLSLGAQSALEGRDAVAVSHAYRFHLPIAVFDRMKQANPELFTITAVSAATGSGIAQ